MLCFVAPKRLAGYGFSSAPNQRVQDCDICPGSRKLLNPYQAISLLRSQIRLVPAARMRLWSNSSQDEGGELGVWLRVRTLKSAAFNLRTRVLGNQFQVIDLGKYTADRATKVAGSCGRPGFSVTLGGSVKGPIRTSPSLFIITFHGSRLPSVPFGFNQLPAGTVLSRR
jgi:hypothetical protein